MSAVDTGMQLRASAGKSKAQILHEYRKKTGVSPRFGSRETGMDIMIGKLRMDETILLRDTLYLLQGISGKHIVFSPPTSKGSVQQLTFAEERVSIG